ncbi:HD-GYP domain-containing protein [Paenibacillus marinisediminis]
MKLAKKIYNDEGMVLLGEGVELSKLYIDRLISMGISCVYVEDERTEGIVAPDMLSDETRRAANKMIRREFKQLMADSTSRKRTVPNLGKPFLELMENIIDDISSNSEAMVMLGDIQTTDYYVYRHSLNVCVYSTMFGIHYGYNREDLKTLAMGALLHDIGKTQIKAETLNKPGRLTTEEYEHMKTHAEIGYRILKDIPNIPLLTAHCAFQHHERLNGSGYPRGIQSKEIHEFAKWIAIADSYDAMTTHRVYRTAMMPHEALEILYTGSNTLYEQHMLQLFRDRIAVYPLGMTVELSTGEIGVVSQINPQYPQRPIIRLLLDPYGQPYQDLRDIDLSTSLNIIIYGSKDDLITGGAANA